MAPKDATHLSNRVKHWLVYLRHILVLQVLPSLRKEGTEHLQDVSYKAQMCQSGDSHPYTHFPLHTTTPQVGCSPGDTLQRLPRLQNGACLEKPAQSLGLPGPLLCSHAPGTTLTGHLTSLEGQEEISWLGRGKSWRHSITLGGMNGCVSLLLLFLSFLAHCKSWWKTKHAGWGLFPQVRSS